VNPRETFSDELLNAYVDGELDEAEKAQLLEALCHDEALNTRVCDLQKVRELLRHAYEHPPAPPSQRPQNTSQWRGAGIAAGIMLTVGTLLGWGLHGYQSPNHQLPNSELLDIAQSMQMSSLTANNDGTWRVVLHVTTDDPRRLKTVLDEAEGLLENRRDHNTPVEVEILANGRGLDLLRTRTSPYADRIQALQARYNNVAFKACQRAIDRVQREQNITVKLLPAARTVPTAIGEVIHRQREGWAYVRI
jgi:uncharacterized protein